jgi:hypothetical protein
MKPKSPSPQKKAPSPKKIDKEKLNEPVYHNQNIKNVPIVIKNFQRFAPKNYSDNDSNSKEILEDDTTTSTTNTNKNINKKA